MNTLDPLPAALPADLQILPTAAGSVALYCSAATSTAAYTLPPMLLVHSVNAAASAAEMAPLFDHYRQSRSVYALDLPGYGFSDRSDRPYTPRLMTDAVLACLEHIASLHRDAPADVVALSLSSEFAVRAQLERPQLVRTLSLISPTGFNGKPRRYGPPGDTLGMPWLFNLLTQPLWRESLFAALTKPSVVRYFLGRSWGSKNIDEALWRYCVRTAREPGASNAPFYFLSAYLFSRDINTLYEALQCPVWVSMATRGDFTDYQGRVTVEGRANWNFHFIDGGALPYFEDRQGFVSRLDAFLAAP